MFNRHKIALLSVALLAAIAVGPTTASANDTAPTDLRGSTNASGERTFSYRIENRTGTNVHVETQVPTRSRKWSSISLAVNDTPNWSSKTTLARKTADKFRLWIGYTQTKSEAIRGDAICTVTVEFTGAGCGTAVVSTSAPGSTWCHVRGDEAEQRSCVFDVQVDRPH